MILLNALRFMIVKKQSCEWQRLLLYRVDKSYPYITLLSFTISFVWFNEPGPSDVRTCSDVTKSRRRVIDEARQGVSLTLDFHPLVVFAPRFFRNDASRASRGQSLCL